MGEWHHKRINARAHEVCASAAHLKHAAIVQVSQLLDGDAWKRSVTLRISQRRGSRQRLRDKNGFGGWG
jgi:hypothetical protein